MVRKDKTIDNASQDPNIFLFPYIALISAFAAQMALLGFIFPLIISHGMCHLMVEDYSRACQREEEKSPEKNHFAVSGI